MSKKVLVTGGAGFIGSNLVRRLLKNNREVIVYDNLSTGKRENTPQGVKLIIADLGERDSITQALEGVETVFHLAASASVIKSVEDPVYDIMNNVLGTANLLEAMKQKGTKRILFSSSSTTYGENTLPMHELLHPNPISPYASGKIMVENLLNNYSRIYGTHPTIFRIFNAYGPFQDLDNSTQGITGYIIGTILQEKPFNVHGKGDQQRDYVFVDDVTEAFIMAEKDPSTFNQIINLGSGTKTSLLDLIKITEEVIGKKANLKFGEPYRKGDVMHYQADTRKLNSLLGIYPSKDIRGNLKKTLGWAQEQLSENASRLK